MMGKTKDDIGERWIVVDADHVDQVADRLRKLEAVAVAARFVLAADSTGDAINALDGLADAVDALDKEG